HCIIRHRVEVRRSAKARAQTALCADYAGGSAQICCRTLEVVLGAPGAPMGPGPRRASGRAKNGAICRRTAANPPEAALGGCYAAAEPGFEDGKRARGAAMTTNRKYRIAVIAGDGIGK